MKPMESVEEVISTFEKGAVIGLLFFWGHHQSRNGRITQSCLSQWYDCSFSVDGVTYHTAEQYMMAQKAKLFGDEGSYEQIMSASDPREYKKLGRLVKGYNEDVWKANRFEIVVTGNIHKFSQNKELRDYLLGTGDFVLVEASPYDNIWGVGMSANNPDIADPRRWKGSNLLGFALMEVRSKIKDEVRNDSNSKRSD